MTTIYVFLGVIVAVSLFIGGRQLYVRSVRIRNRLQMGQVFTNISHELLTPLTVISASVERLRNMEPRYGTDYALMELNIQRMVRLLQEILETSKSLSGSLKLRVSHGDVMQHINQTALCLEPLMYKQGLEFSIHCTPTSMMGWIDTDKLDKIIYNLLSNAAKYSVRQTEGTEHGHVMLDVHTNKTYDHIIIKVTDNGTGISAEQLKHMFQRYHDGDYRRANTTGTGLGLALTRDLVELHGGSINCDSSSERGTTFTVTLPIRKEAFTQAQIDEEHRIDLSKPRTTIIDLDRLMPKTDVPHPLTIRMASDDSYKILIVEDNKELLMLMQSLLSGRYRIVTARNGAEALKVIRKQELDLIVSDVMMPEMDGYELTRLVKANPVWSHLPVILLTARTQDKDRQQSMILGADDYIAKPFRLSDLQLRIDNIIENRKRITREKIIQGEMADADGNVTTETARPTADELFMEQARNCVMEHLADSDFDRDAFAAEMGTSASTLYNRLRVLTGKNVSTYIRDTRLNEAYRIAQQQPDLRVSDLTYRVGFKDPKYFATCFRKAFGVQPSEFLELVQHGRSETY